MSFKLNSISLGSAAKKRYTRSLNYDNNTTMPFGFLQPILSQRLEANSDISFSVRQLIRLAPLPVPSFGRMKLVNKSVFVPFADVCPYYEAFLSEQPYTSANGSFKPSKLPFTSSACLQFFLLSRSYYSTYVKSSTSSQGSEYQFVATDSSSYNWFNTLATSIFGSGSIISPPDFSKRSQSLDDAITIDGADYVAQIDSTHIMAFRYTQEMRNLRSIFIGLGYSLDLYSTKSVSILPLLCYYKAWFDSFAPQRSLAWTNTNCYRLIRIIDDKYSVAWNSVQSNGDFNIFANFLSIELANCWYIPDDDFVSIHRSKPVTDAASRNLSYINQLGAAASLSVPSSVSSVDMVTLNTIQTLTRFVNKDSVIGRKMSAWVRTHFGAQIANSLYKDVYQVNTFDVPLSVDDIFSSSDTAVTTGANAGDGELLGAYAGLGIGSTDKDHPVNVHFHAPVGGYFFCMSCIVPISSYCQGDTGDLYCIDRDTVPFPEFDALGYELNPRSMFLTSNDIYSYSALPNGSHSTGDKGFGFVPRYSSLKVKRNVINGDMSRRGTFSSLSPYYLDRVITQSTASQSDGSKSGYFKIDIQNSDAPSASEAWRYVCRYPWLGNFNRIFYNNGSSTIGSVYNSPLNWLIDDNFIVQSVFELKVTDFLKPLSLSWDTYDESTDSSSVDVKAD